MGNPYGFHQKIPDLSSSTASATSLGWPKRLASVGDWKPFWDIFGTFLLGTVEYEPGWDCD